MVDNDTDSTKIHASSKDDWESDTQHPPTQGGQGTVVKVRHRQSGITGALKSLHPQHLHVRERRYRMQQEVALLKLFDAQGMPRVLDDNVAEWESDTPLWAVIEWVGGPHLGGFSNGEPVDIDTALAIVNGLTEILRYCHAARVQHRDIKPDNIILRNGDISKPVLIDFGMGWAMPDEQPPDFVTAAGQELGNRFLRLPEYAPGHHSYSTRSDITMLVAVLFYLLTGSPPRVLLDSQGKMPHEALHDRFPAETTSDPRWKKLRRIFTVGFQNRLDQRYLDAEALSKALMAVSGPLVTSAAKQALEEQYHRVRELTESADGALLEKCQRDSQAALQACNDELHGRLRGIRFQVGGQGPTVAHFGRAVKTTLYASNLNFDSPKIGFVHQVSFQNGRYEAAYSFVGEALWHTHYEGPFADSESLRDAAIAVVDELLAEVLKRWTAEYETQVTRMRAVPDPTART